ncbi:MAG: M67 family metallopeptidase [Deltaproteobacteria bacterium]|jgi:proteasome lid subunit RPN8/RPN11|nr:M67 family metallopeptidase [Deltaproteobacteria bacterium]
MREAEGGRLVIPADIEKRLREEGEKAYPEECCGFVLGHDEKDVRFAEELIVLENARKGSARRRRFSIEADEFMRAEREASVRGREITGIYHSHPDHPALPSEYDKEHALPFYSYVILSVAGGKAGEVKSFVLEADRSSFAEEKIVRREEEAGSP